MKVASFQKVWNSLKAVNCIFCKSSVSWRFFKSFWFKIFCYWSSFREVAEFSCTEVALDNKQKSSFHRLKFWFSNFHLEDAVNYPMELHNFQKKTFKFCKNMISISISSLFIQKSSLKWRAADRLLKFHFHRRFTISRSPHFPTRFSFSFSTHSVTYLKYSQNRECWARNATESKKSISGWKKGWFLVSREKFFRRVAKKSLASQKLTIVIAKS